MDKEIIKFSEFYYKISSIDLNGNPKSSAIDFKVISPLYTLIPFFKASFFFKAFETLSSDTKSTKYGKYFLIMLL